MDILALVIFIAKAVFAELMIEAVRFASYTIWHNAYPDTLLLTHQNKYFSWFINSLESAAVIALLYYGFSFVLTVVLVTILTFVVKQTGSAFLRWINK